MSEIVLSLGPLCHKSLNDTILMFLRSTIRNEVTNDGTKSERKVLPRRHLISLGLGAGVGGGYVAECLRTIDIAASDFIAIIMADCQHWRYRPYAGVFSTPRKASS